MQRYFVKPEQMSNHTVAIEGDDVAHITRVMRMRKGDQIICSNGQGRDVLAEIDSVQGQMVLAKILEELPADRELPVHVTIAQSLPKGEKMDWIVQKSTELGARCIIPFISARTVVQWDASKISKRLHRWRRIAKEAAEQSQRSILPIIETPVDWSQLIAKSREMNLVMIAYEGEGTTPLNKVLPACQPGGNILLVIGPEGGFEPEEVEIAMASGMKAVSLGRRILRTETASLYGLAAISYHFERD